MEKFNAWHFVANDRKLRYGDGREVGVGETYSVSPPTVLCRHGMHWSINLLDALNYASGHILTYCEVWGDIKQENDKGVSTHRKVLALVDAEELLFRAAQHFAAEVFYKHFKEGDYPPIDAWLLHGDKSQKYAARSAAWYAARSAASAAAESAARSAARYAARSAARSAARYAAEYAAWSAAEYATSAARNSWLEAEAKKLMNIR